MKNALYVFVGAALLAALLWVGKMEADDNDDALRHYCQMVEIYNESNGEYGWPDNGECEE